MPDRPTIEKLGLKLEDAVGDRLQWVVAGHRVGAEWEKERSQRNEGKAHPERQEVGGCDRKRLDVAINTKDTIGRGSGQTRQSKDTDCEYRHLGGPSNLNKADGDLSLWMAWDTQNRQLLTVLSMSVRLHAGRANSRRRMFLVIPSESLQISSQVAHFQSLPIDKVPEALFERPDDGLSAESVAYLDMTFHLDSDQKSKVIMTTQKYPNTVRGTPLNLLDGLKSLSEASHFTLYMKFNTYAQHDLRIIQAQLQTYVFATPTILLHRMYPGGHDGGFDLWLDQGWSSTSKCQSPAKRKRPINNVDRTPSPPPAYDQHKEKAFSPVPHFSPTPVPVPAYISASASALLSICSPAVCQSPFPGHRRSSIVRSQSGSCVVETPIAACLPTPSRIVKSQSTSASVASRFYRELPLWLCMAWKDCPTAHYFFIDHLLAAGAAAWIEDEDQYHNARVACAAALTRHRARARVQGDDEQVTLDDIVNNHEPSRLISWAITLDPLADIYLSPHLTSFEIQRQQIAQLTNYHGDDKDMYDALWIKATNFKALCVVDVCFRMASRTIEHEEKDMVALMAKELHRQGLKS